ncbi:Gfo/Idh/MocA family oxidoreductase [Paenibacillus larvae]
MYKVGLIGCGNIFPMHAASVGLTPEAELAAVCDVKEERASQAGGRYQVPFYTDYKQMIEKEKLDAVHILTPHYLHPQMAIYAASKGVHVLTEKPMSISFEDAEAMVQAAAENHITLGVIFQNRYNPGSQMVKQALSDGSLGRILGAKCFVTWNRSDEYYSHSDWKGTWDKEGGGVIIDQAIHTLDLLRWFVNDEIEYVDATISNRAHSRIEVEDSAEGVIKYKNGVVTGFWAVNYYSTDAPVEIEIHCEKGIAKMVADRAIIHYNDGTEMSRDKNPDEVIDYGEGVKQYWGVSHYKQIKEFYSDLSSGKKPFVDGHEAMKTQRMIAAIYQSGRENKRIFF